MSPIAITCGEPAGIGPEISLRAAWQYRAEIPSILIGDATYLSCLARKCGIAVHVLDGLFSDRQAADLSCIAKQCHVPMHLTVLDCPFSKGVSIVPGYLNGRHADGVLHSLDIAIEGILRGYFAAIVTAPVQKSTLNNTMRARGGGFIGHTEYFAEKTDTSQVVMMLVTQATTLPLRVAFATTHLPLRDVAEAISADHLMCTLRILHQALAQTFRLSTPRILVAGLNPHAGESGHLGNEEQDVVVPVIRTLQQQGMAVDGPYPADTLFQPKYLNRADAVLVMYHDQGLPVFKYASFGQGVNITLGLPFIRTSVDHGTALDIAAKGVGHADDRSMIAALRMAASLVS